MTATAKQASLVEVTHHYAKVNGTQLHYVAAGTRRISRPAGPRVP